MGGLNFNESLAAVIITGRISVRCPRCQEQRSDTGYEGASHRGPGFIFSSIRSAHFTLAAKGNFAHRGVSIAFA
jgi:hypothetical protein